MNTFLLEPNDQGISLGATLLRQGELVAFPTETVYGLGAPVFSPETIAKIFCIKGRPHDNPLIVHLASIEQVECVVDLVPETFYKLARLFLPGPLTIILPKSSKVPSIVSAGQSTIGIRVPAHPVARNLIAAVGEPLVAPSANLSGKPSSTSAQHVLEDFQGKIAAVLDGGVCQYGLESTVLSLTPYPMILRPGTITAEELSAVLGMEVGYACHKADRPLSPGMKYRHYAPKGRLVFFDSQVSLQAYLEQAPPMNRLVLDPPRAEDVYARFREADREGCEEILVVCDETVSLDAALMNRLSRAADK